MTPITTTEALRAFCQRLADQPFITVDTEFMRETTYWPRLCLIQAASATDAAIIEGTGSAMTVPGLGTVLAGVFRFLEARAAQMARVKAVTRLATR